jgi:sterol desaturase/sphingolipid hydroxylase (fatty acid hydroxylase superfamily)
MDAAAIRQTLLIFALVALAASLIEGLVLSWRGTYNWRSTGASLFIAVGRRLTDFLPLSIALPGGLWLYQHRLFELPLNRWWSWVVLFIGLEFFYYWFHRASHRMRRFWASHSVHHSPNEFNLSAAYRLGWTGKLTRPIWTIWTPTTAAC